MHTCQIPANHSLYSVSTLLVSQVKSNLIRQREVEQLVPAAGPGSSDVLHLLRPLAAIAIQPSSTTAAAAPSVHKSAEMAETIQEAIPAAATESRAKSFAGGGGVTATLMGMSCVIGAGGEVLSLPNL
jgi:hypothetical protein